MPEIICGGVKYTPVDADIEDYLKEYKKALIHEIKSGKKVQV